MIIDKIEKPLKEKVFSKDFLWFFNERSTPNGPSFLAHAIKHRDKEIEGEFWDYIKEDFHNVLERNNLKLDKIHRAAVNLMTNFGDVPFAEPHVDHRFPHHNMLIYCNTVEGDTFIFNEKYNNEYLHPIHLTLKDKVSPEEGKVIIFNGEHYHSTGKIPTGTWRAVIVITFTTTPA